MISKKRIFIQGFTFLASSLMFLTAATASSNDTPLPTKDSIQKAFPFFPKIDEIRQVPNSDFIEIRTGKSNIAYTDQKLSYLIRGELHEAKTGFNITQDRVSELSAIDFKKLDLKNAIKIVYGTGERKMATFEDPNCGFCKRYTKTIQEANNVTVYVFLYPILGADSLEKSKNIWCAKDKEKTYQAWMLRGEVPAAASCDTTAIDRNKAFGAEHAIRGTPGSIFSSGKTISGAVDVKTLNEMLAR